MIDYKIDQIRAHYTGTTVVQVEGYVIGEQTQSAQIVTVGVKVQWQQNQDPLQSWSSDPDQLCLEFTQWLTDSGHLAEAQTRIAQILSQRQQASLDP